MDEIYAEWAAVPVSGLSERFVREPYNGQRVVAIAEAPGEEEDERGIPLCGRAGQEWNANLAAAGWARSNIHCLNIVPRRPPNNRTPSVKERGIHGQYAKAVVRAINPDLIILLGGIAIKEFLGLEGIEVIRGSPRKWENWQAIATWHPASVLQVPSDQIRIKRRADIVQDLQTARGLIDGTLKDVSRNLNIVTNKSGAEWKAFLDRCQQSSTLAIDLETNNRTDWWNPACRITHIALYPNGGPAGVAEWGPGVQNAVAGLLEGHTGIVGHNLLQFDRPLLRRYGIELACPVIDTQFLSYAINENPPHTLESLAVQYLNVLPWKHLKDESIIQYAGADVYVTYQLVPILLGLLDTKAQRIYERILVPLADALSRVSEAGILVDTEAVLDLSDWVDRNYNRCERILRAIVPGGINFSSADQVAKILYDRFGLIPPKRTPTDKRGAVDEEALQKLAAEAPDRKSRQFCRILLRRSSLETTRNRYVTTIIEAVGQDGRIRSSLNAMGTVTGRRTASAPSGGPGINQQQIDRRPIIRNCFAAPEGKVLIQRDYVQIQPRLAAWLASENRLLDIFRRGGDVYRQIGSLLFNGKSADNITPHERQISKSAVLAMIFKQTKWGLQNYLARNGIHVDIEESDHYWHQFHRVFPQFRRWHDKIEAQVISTGVIESPFGRKRHLPDALLKGDDKETIRRRTKAVREAINFPIQSGEADITAMAIVLLDRKIDWDRVKIIQDGHDALLFEVPEEEADFWVSLTGEVMNNPPTKEWFGVEIPVSIISEAKVGKRWGSLRKLV